MLPVESQWSYEAAQFLVSLAREGVPASIISPKLKRPVVEVRSKLSDLAITPLAEA